jgi:hypothetical protein
MIQSRDGTRFKFEPAEMIGIVARCRTDQLKSDVPPQPFIARTENVPHGPRANFFEHSVMTYDRTGHPLARPAGMVGCMSFGVNNPCVPPM